MSVSQNILKFSEFFVSLKFGSYTKIQEDSGESILKQATKETKSSSEDSSSTSKSTSLGKSSISVSDLFYGTEMGKKIAGEFHKDENKELLTALKKKGILPQDWTSGDESSQSGDSVKKDIESLNSAGVSTADEAETKEIFKELKSGDYKFDDVKDLSWEGLKYILEKKGLAREMNFKKYNLVGLRNYLSVKKNYPNRFIDALILMSPENEKSLSIMQGTTVPGASFLISKLRNYWFAKSKEALNPDGLAILQPGVYPYKIGKHNDYDALVQAGPVKVERFPIVDDVNKAKFTTFSPGNAETGNYGINIHRGNKTGTTEEIGWYSAGCIVFKNASDLQKVLQKMKKENQNQIDFVLVEMDDVPAPVLASAIKGEGDKSTS